MSRPRVRHLVLVVAGTVLVGSGLALTGAQPRADAPDIGRPVAAAAPSPVPSPAPAPTGSGTASPVPTSSAPAEPLAAAPVAVALPTSPDPVPLVPVGVLAGGVLQLPERPTVLGWYAAGALPGSATGTAVVAGHLDSARYGSGPLEGLLALREGDVVAVTDAAGAVHRYAVASRTSLPKSALPADLFRADGPPRLALVTCGGAFDERTASYSDNLVVVADPVP